VRRLVGENVRQIRLSAGLSQEELAERMGVDRAYVSGLELGQRNPTIVTLWHTAEALKVPIARLLETTDHPSEIAPPKRKRAPRRVST
jgi:transcriptional regulator with XRE-family HTH domain